jgi:deazaflavin-dependent oxidoreductase (nitroreductase family)
MNDKPQLHGRKPMEIPTDMRAFNEALITEFRAGHGELSGPMAGRSILLLTTTGARSGRRQTTVLGFGRSGTRLVVIASNNGAPKAPAWYHHLLANPTATVELGPERFEVRATTAAPEQRAEFAAAVPYLAQQQGLTSRELPLVILDRV